MFNFLQRTLKQLLLHLFFSQQLLHQLGIVLRDISHRFTTLPDEALQCQVIGGRESVMSVLLNFLFGLLDWFLNFGILLQDLFKNLLVHWDWLLATNYARILFWSFYLLKPNMRADVL